MLAALLGATEAGRVFLSQVANVVVVSRCGCGCRTVDLRQPPGSEPLTGPSKVVASAAATSPDGVPLDLSAHVREGEVAELEIYASDGSENFNLPAVEDVELWAAV